MPSMNCVQHRRLNAVAVRGHGRGVRSSTRPARLGVCHAKRIGLVPEEDLIPDDLPEGLTPPESMFGLTSSQMMAMGLAGQDVERLQKHFTPEALRASHHYVPQHSKITAGPHQPTTMRAGSYAAGPRGPSTPPPDLPSLLLDRRIVYIGMPLVASVTELIVSELLWLQYADPQKQIFMYINSIGSQQDDQAIGFETEAYAIQDTMNYVRPDITTIALCQAYGNACMLLAAGTKGKRASMPHSHIKMAPPRINRSFGPTADLMTTAGELEKNSNTYFSFMAKHTGQTEETIRKDCERDKYFTPATAIEYGIIDSTISTKEEKKSRRVSLAGTGSKISAAPRQTRDEGPEAAGA